MPEKKKKQMKDLSWLMVSEVSVHGLLALLLFRLW
jgi:hypothetical protein